MAAQSDRQAGTRPADGAPTARQAGPSNVKQQRTAGEQHRPLRPPPPPPVFDDALPVNARREEIARAIAAHQVVIVCGETGSGKTTQLPKICLTLGRGQSGVIGHTQPRRIAARATATRIAQELGSELGRMVGYKIRFTDRTSPESYIKLMTDGILLAETQTDPLLRQYDTLIIDEAHERSLNIDFLLGYLKRLLPKRADLKLIVTSATLDAERFAEHFSGAPVIEVSGRLHPVEIRWRPWEESGERDINDAIVDAVHEAQCTGPGDVLVFLPGEREIREAAEALRKASFGAQGLEILPLYARQSAEEQARVFRSFRGRRVVLATNVAETSLTVPGIRYVVDTGLARIKRYSNRNKVEQLRVEPIAQSAAKQRAGRCGRVASGICFRLYSEEDFAKRPLYTDPEILRSSLAGVILRMRSLALGEIEAFPFLEAPPPRMVTDGYQQLIELCALDEQSRQLTAIGCDLAKLPLDPKIGRMLLAARRYGCLREVLIIAAALSVQDPRERPAEQQAAADQAHAKWQDEKSEFLSFLKLWQAADEVWRHQTNAKQRAFCKREFLSWLRVREWRDVHGQLMTLCHEHGWLENSEPASYEAIHKALLSGLLGHIGLKSEEEKHYLGARGIRFFIHPGSTLAKKAGRWVMAGELVETSKLFARTLARIEPAWLEEVGAHLLRRHIFEPHWEKGSGQVAAFERVTLHGLLLHGRRRLHYGPLDQKLAREILIRHALVQGEVGEEWLRRWRFLQHNLKLKREIEALEHKTRRPDVLVDDELIFAFYEAIVPEGLTTLVAFDRWRREAEAHNPKLLFLEKEQLMRHEAAGITSEAFPSHLDYRGQRFRLSYHHDPGAADDGITLHLPLPALNQLPETRLDWLVPGLLKEKVLALLKTLPHKYRHRLQPLDAFAEDFCAGEHDTAQPLAKALTGAIEDRLALKLPLDALRVGELRPHLSMNVRLLDEHGATLAMSRDFAELRARFGERATQAFAETSIATSEDGVPTGLTLSGCTDWSFGPLPELMELTVAGRGAIGFPALEDEGNSVALRIFDSEEKAQAVHHAGLRRLFALAMKEQVRAIEKALPRDLTLAFISFGSEKDLQAQVLAQAIDRACLMPPWPRDAEAFAARIAQAKGRLTLIAQEVQRLLQAILSEHAALKKKLQAMQKAFPVACADIEAQLMMLLPKDFISQTPWERLAHYPRYLKAASLRLDKARNDAARDTKAMNEWQALARPWQREWTERQRQRVHDPFLTEFRWLLEELRVALYAQELKTPSPVSAKRLQKMWEGRTRG